MTGRTIQCHSELDILFFLLFSGPLDPISPVLNCVVVHEPVALVAQVSLERVVAAL